MRNREGVEGGQDATGQLCSTPILRRTHDMSSKGQDLETDIFQGRAKRHSSKRSTRESQKVHHGSESPSSFNWRILVSLLFPTPSPPRSVGVSLTMNRVQDDQTLCTWWIRPREDEGDPPSAEEGGRQSPRSCWLLRTLSSYEQWWRSAIDHSEKLTMGSVTGAIECVIGAVELYENDRRGVGIKDTVESRIWRPGPILRRASTR